MYIYIYNIQTLFVCAGGRAGNESRFQYKAFIVTSDARRAPQTIARSRSIRMESSSPLSRIKSKSESSEQETTGTVLYEVFSELLRTIRSFIRS